MVVVGSSRQMQVMQLPVRHALCPRLLNDARPQVIASRVKKAIAVESALHDKAADIGSDGRRRCAAAH